MFHLKFAPSFRRQKEALLREKSIPQLVLPETVELCLRGFHETATPRELGGARLWIEVARVMRPLLVRAALVSVVASACAALSTLAAMRILDAGRDLRSMWLFSAVYFLMNCMAHGATLYSGRLRCWVGLGAESHLVGLISAKLLRLSALAAARQSSGNLKTLITSDVRNIGQFLDNATRNLIPALTGLIVITPLLVYFTGRAGAVGVVVMAMVAPVSLALNAVNTRFQNRSQSEIDRLTSLAGEWVKNIRLIRYLSWDEVFQRDVSSRLRRFMTVSVAQHFMACLIYGLSMSWWMVSATGVVVAAQLFNYPLDFAGFFGSLWLLTFLAGYFTHLPNTIRLYGLAAPSARRIARLLREDEQADYLSPGEEVEANAVPQRVVFENVSFRYPDGRLALQDVSLSVALDTQLAIVGEVASGKTTFLKLLCGELPPTEGRIRVEFDNGQSRDLWTSTAYTRYRNHLAYVPQEPFVSSDLLHTNISLSADASHEDVATAAYWAELEADLAAFPDGLSQEIGESGVNLSGGQRQRLNLARAFYSHRRLMVLDDTLSAVDTKTEAALMERLLARPGGFVLVTHRTGELLHVREVAVMKDGIFVERGDPRVLASDPDSNLNRVLRAYEREAARA